VDLNNNPHPLTPSPLRGEGENKYNNSLVSTLVEKRVGVMRIIKL
jgi:hypothetical protein